MARQGQLAEKFRAGLDSSVEAEQAVSDSSPTPIGAAAWYAEKNPLDERWMGKPVREHVKEFACLFAFIFLAVSTYFIWKGRYPVATTVLTVSAFLVALLGYRAPSILHPLWKGWMAFAEKLGVVSSYVILSLAWATVVVPISLLVRVMGKKVMDVSFRQPVDSYWEVRNEKMNDFVRLERQF